MFGGPGGPAEAGGSTGAFARFGSLTPAAGLAAVKRASAGGLSTTRNRALVAGGVVLAIVAIVGVIMAPRWFGGSSDPGCKAYTGTALPAYNKAIEDLNGHASQGALSAELAQAVSSLQAAVGTAQGATAKAALGVLLADLKAVQADVRSGSVPTKTVAALNKASTAADHACS